MWSCGWAAFLLETPASPHLHHMVLLLSAAPPLSHLGSSFYAHLSPGSPRVGKEPVFLPWLSTTSDGSGCAPWPGPACPLPCGHLDPGPCSLSPWPQQGTSWLLSLWKHKFIASASKMLTISLITPLSSFSSSPSSTYPSLFSRFSFSFQGCCEP